MSVRVAQSESAERLRLERRRLGMTQAGFAAAVGVQRRAQVFYEAGSRQPSLSYLEAAARLGVDVGYIVTGERAAASQGAAPGRNSQERGSDLLEWFQRALNLALALPEADRQMWFELGRTIASKRAAVKDAGGDA